MKFRDPYERRPELRPVFKSAQTEFVSFSLLAGVVVPGGESSILSELEMRCLTRSVVGQRNADIAKRLSSQELHLEAEEVADQLQTVRTKLEVPDDAMLLPSAVRAGVLVVATYGDKGQFPSRPKTLDVLGRLAVHNDRLYVAGKLGVVPATVYSVISEATGNSGIMGEVAQVAALITIGKLNPHAYTEEQILPMAA